MNNSLKGLLIFITFFIFLTYPLFFYGIIEYYFQANIISKHIKEEYSNYAINIRTYCYHGNEYLIVNGSGTSSSPILDSDGKPNKCNY